MNIYHWVLISFDSMFSCKGLIADMEFLSNLCYLTDIQKKVNKT